MNDQNFPMHVSLVVLNAAQLTAVYALLGGASPVAVARGSTAAEAAPKPQPAPQPAPLADGGTQGSEAGMAAATAPVSGEVDTGGHPWSADLHAATKGKTKEGYWRMAVGKSRPDDLPGFGKNAPGGATGTSSAGTASNAIGSASTGTATDDDDEFAAFARAAGAANATDQAAAAGAPARSWSDADVGKLCNQAAVKVNSPDKVKELIAKYVPQGEVVHSRNVPADKREAFAREVEASHGITFAG